MEQPFKKADAMIFLAAGFERASFEFLNLVRMSLMGFILMAGVSGGGGEGGEEGGGEVVGEAVGGREEGRGGEAGVDA